MIVLTEEIRAFLEQESLTACCYDLAGEVERFRAEMRAGLSGAPSSLYMIPTFLPAKSGNVPDGKVIVLDAGGTNLRVGTATFSRGRAQDVVFQKTPLPGTEETLDAEGFFDRIAEKLAPYLQESDRVGFCFSYAANCREDGDAEIISFCKEVSVTGAKGLPVCASLRDAIRRRGERKDYRFVQLNDTAAAMLGGMAVTDPDGYDGFIGFILGTGMNSCYAEKTENVTKYKGGAYRESSMIVNMESGCYARFAGGSIDKEINAASTIPGDHQTEKMLSGAYLGKLLAAALQKAAQKGLLSAHADTNEIPMPEINRFLAGEENLLSAQLPEKDHAAVREIIEGLYSRTARLMTVIFTAVALQTGKGKEKPICIVMEGSTYQKSPRLQELLAEDLARAEERFGCRFDIVFAENATLTGAAYAAATLDM